VIDAHQRGRLAPFVGRQIGFRERIAAAGRVTALSRFSQRPRP